MRDPRDSDEALFARYRNHGDVQALGALFDRRAIDLFRLALYLGHHASEAEDLLQATFLSAIEGADNFDGARPLMPWLIGILTNHARRSRRQQRREVVPELLTHDAVPDPRLAAETRELRASLSTALKSVPQPYRQVLALHLEHGLTARAIGELLERSAGTVRSQVVRGLELLRRALPTGLVGGLALMLTPGHALAGVRVEVLRTASQLVPTAAVGVTGKSLVTRLLASMLVLGLGVSTMAAFAFGEAASPVEVATTTGAPGEQARAEAIVDGASAAALHSRSTPGSDDAAANAAPALADLEVRLTTSGGEPLRGVPCRLVADTEGPELLVVRALRTAPFLLRSDDEGWVRAPGMAAGGYRLWVVGSLEHLDLVLPEPSRDWTLPATRIVTGTVLTADGSPAAGASVFASATLGSQEPSTEVATTDEHGAFAFAALPDRSWAWSRLAGHVASPAVSFYNQQNVELALGRSPARLGVTVRGPSGELAEGVAVGAFPAGDAGQPRAPSYAVTDRRGRVEFDGLPVGEVILAARCIDGVSRRQVFRVGAGELAERELRVERGASVRGRVVDGEGQPMVRRAVFAQTASLRPWSFDGSLQARLAYTDADGRYVISGLGTEPLRLRLVAKSLDREVEQRSLTLGAGETVTLDWGVVSRSLQGRVRGASVADWSDWTVLAVPLGREGTLLKMHRFEVQPDANGRFELEIPDRFANLRLFAAPADCPDSRALYHASCDCQLGASPIELVVQGHATARCAQGRLVVPAGIQAASTRLVLMRGGSVTRLPLTPEGGFVTGRLPLDDYRLVAWNPELGTLHRSFDLADGGDIGDIAWPEPAGLTVLAPGSRRFAGARLWLEDDTGDVVIPMALAEPTAVSPGDYWLCATGPELAPQRDRLTFASGELVQHELRTDPAVPCAFEFPFESIDNVIELDVEMHLEVRRPDGSVVVRDSVKLEERDQFRWNQALAPGVYSIIGSTDWGGVIEHELTVIAGEPMLRAVVPVRTGDE